MKKHVLDHLIVSGLLAALVDAPVMATSLDLTAGGSGSLNTAFFTTTEIQSTGSGVIDPFVRIQGHGSIEGYNATARPLMPNVKTSPTFTHDLRLSDITQVVNPTGANPGVYYEFLLDINQSHAKSLLSLDKLVLYTSSTALPSADQLSDLTGGATERFNLGFGNEILLNYALNSGSGSGDLFAYIPVESFTGASSGDYLYLYSMFGGKGGDYAENGGFEEWAARAPNTVNILDGGATAALLILSVASLSFVTRRRQAV